MRLGFHLDNPSQIELQLTDEAFQLDVELQVAVARVERVPKVVLAAPDREVAPAGCCPQQRDGHAKVVHGVEDAGRPLDVNDARHVVVVLVLGLLLDAALLLSWSHVICAARVLHETLHGLDQRFAVAHGQIEKRRDRRALR